MKIGFYIKWPKNSISSKGNVVGDELYGEQLSKTIRKKGNIECEVYAPNYLPSQKLDIMIYLNDTPPLFEFSDKHILYIQNGYGETAEYLISKLVKYNYDGYIFFSKKLKDIYDNKYRSKGLPFSLYLPFGVDTDFFYPRQKRNDLSFEVAYVGNDIKGEEATIRYIYPAINFNFGLFGNWAIPKHRFKLWKNFLPQPEYKRVLAKISKGKIPQEDIPYLYSSSKIILNCTLPVCIEWDVITSRTFEVLSCNGFLITDIVPSAIETLKDYVVFTTGYQDLIDKIKYYLENEDERIKISAKGYDFVKENASLSKRVDELFNYIQEVL